MDGITFPAAGTDLVDILDVLGAVGRAAQWRLSADFEAAGKQAPAEQLMQDAEDGRAIDGRALRELAAGVQFIDGDLHGYVGSELIASIRAVDGTWWDLYSPRAELLRTAATTFPAAKDIPQ
jgi:hypothetical protein